MFWSIPAHTSVWVSKRLSACWAKSVRLQPDIAGLTLERLSEFIHYRIDVLLGGDFLGLMPFTIDFSDNDLRFHDRPVRFQGKDLETDLFAGVPMVEVSIAGRPVTLVLDTGAKISFLDPSIIRDYPPVGKNLRLFPILWSVSNDTS